MKTRIIIFIFLTIIAKNIMAQDSSQAIRDTMDTIFQKVDKSKIATGLLTDYGVQMVDPEAFNGTPGDSNYVNMDTWKMLYAGMYSSIINGNAHLTSPDTVIAAINNLPQSGDTVPLAMMQYQYNKFNDSAVQLGLLQVVNNQIVEVAGAASPYLTRQLFAVAPQSLYFSGATAAFVFKQSLWFTNSGKTVQKLEVNFNNESGYITVAWNATVSYSFGVAGQKTIYFRLTYTDGSNYSSQTNIVVAKGTVQLLAASIAPYSNITSIAIPASTLHSGGTLQIAYASSNTTGQLRKPLIVAEGFDVYGVIPGVKNTDINDFLGNNNNNYGTINLYYGNGGNLKDSINFSQYDIVYVDNNVGTDDIRRNAKLFEEAIEWVNAHKAADAQPNVVMGLSMGGLVARYALRDMEIAGIDHKTWKFISVDAPHEGANVPVSIQAAVRHLENLDLKIFFINLFSAPDISSDLKGAINLLNTMAAKQMLIYYVNDNFAYDNSVHAAFMQELNGMGFPQQCQNVAITDGSGQGATTFAPGSGLVNLSESYTLNWWQNALATMFGGAFSITNYPQLVINIIPGKSQIYANLYANALPNKQATTIYEGRVYFKKTIAWLIAVSVDLTKKTLNSTSDMLPIDGAPGGLYNVNTMMNLSGGLSQYILQPQFCFVPTVSALGLSNWQNKLTSNLQNEDFYASGTSDFDRYFTPAGNELHTRLNSSAQFLLNHLNYPVFCFNPNISTFCGSDNSTVKNSNNYPLTWSVSQGYSITSYNNISAQVSATSSNQMGILTCSYNGIPVRKQIWSTCNLAISGSNLICSNATTTYTIPNLPASVLVTWNQSANLQQVSGLSGNSQTFQAVGNGAAWVVATVNGIQHLDTLKLWIGAPQITGISGTTNVKAGGSFSYTCSYSGSGTVTWSAGPIIAAKKPTIQVSTYNPPGTSIADYMFLYNGGYGVTATITNQCGSATSIYGVTVTGGYDSNNPSCPTCPVVALSNIENPNSVSKAFKIKTDTTAATQSNIAYPNPVSGTLNVSTSAIAHFIQANGSPIAGTCTVRLYDEWGKVLQQTATNGGDKVQFSVAKLPNGVYFLEISNGKQTSKQTVVVKH